MPQDSKHGDAALGSDGTSKTHVDGSATGTFPTLWRPTQPVEESGKYLSSALDIEPFQYTWDEQTGS